MDYSVSIEDATKYFPNFPNTRGYPNFTMIRAIRHCLEKGLRQIKHPDRDVMGWAGLATDPEMYKLVDTVPWATPTNPGKIAMFGTNDTSAEMKMKQATFTRDKNMFTSHENISSAIVRLLMANIEEKYQISNVSGVQGWHNNMTVMDILTQLQTKYGAPDPDAVAAMETMFSKPHNPNDAPEVLYSVLEECQKIAMMNENPWSEQQVMMKAVDLLQRSGIFKDKVFEEWKDGTNKSYVAMKDHFHKAYMKRLESIQTSMTSGRGGYSNANPFSALNMTAGSETESDGGDTVDTIVAAAMASTEAKMDSIINSQQQLFQQFANFTMNQPHVPPTMPPTVMPPAYMAPTFGPPPAQARPQYNAPPPMQYVVPRQVQYNAPAAYPPQQWQPPPVNQVTVPTQYGGYTYGGSRRGRGRGRGGSRNGRGRGSATYHDTGATVSVLTAGTSPTVRYGPQGMPMTHTNPVKKYNNWDMCYSCGFDVESGHTSMTCPYKKVGHQDGCNRGNYQQYQTMGHHPSMKGAHKNQLPTM
jgi:hypothetical protein